MKNSKIEKQIEVFSQLAKQDKNIDVASLVINALDDRRTDSIPANQKRWAYIISIGAPPFGLLFALKFWFSGKDDGAEAALFCVLLTTISTVVLVVTAKMLLSGSGQQLEQVQQIKPADIKQLYE